MPEKRNPAALAGADRAGIFAATIQRENTRTIRRPQVRPSRAASRYQPDPALEHLAAALVRRGPGDLAEFLRELRLRCGVIVEAAGEPYQRDRLARAIGDSR